jgi:hypothetical protein
MNRKALLWWVMVLNFLPLQMYGLDYSNPQLGFKARLPDNLDDVSIRVAVRGGLISLGKWNSSHTALIKMISLQDLGGTIGREDLSKKQDKPAGVTLEKTHWQSFDIDVFKVEETTGKVTNITLNAQVPLKPRAIQVSVMGPAAEEASLRQEMQAIVTSVAGTSNWLTPDERVSRLAAGGGRLAFVSAFVCVLVIGIVKVVRKIISW